jgi:arginyl-tRNA synthetase
MNAEDVNIIKSRLSLAYLAKETLTLMLFLLGIEAPEIMLKAS